MEFDKDKDKDTSLYDLLVLVELSVKSNHNIYREKFPSDISVGEIKDKIFTKYGESVGIYNNHRRLPDPELYILVVFDSEGFPLSPVCKDDSQSLKNFLGQVGYSQEKSVIPVPIRMRIALECTWFDCERSFINAKKYKKKRGYVYEEKYPEHDGYWSSDSELELELEYAYKFEYEIEDIMDRKRPHDILEYDKKMFWVYGRLHVEDHTNKRRPVARLGGLPCNLKEVVKMTTTAKHVVLVFTSDILSVLTCYRALLDQDITTDPDDKILVINLTWDRFSYLFLRKLRKDVGPSVPFLAITESHVNELDLLAFLDTPPSQLTSFYKWDDSLYQHCVALKLDEVDVDIKWVGLWPSEALNYRDFLPTASPFNIDSAYYRMVCDTLKTHPQLQAKPMWLNELKVFDKHPYYFDITGVSSMYFSRHFNKYFPKKLANEDWI